MTVRLHFCILTLLVIILISLQNPIPIVKSDVSQTKYPDLQASKYKEKEDRSHNARFKMKATDESSESHYNNQHDLGDLEKPSKEENGRNKRLEIEEDDGVMERNQFYKPINEETKVHPVISSKQEKEGKPDQKIANDLLGHAKLAIAKAARYQRQDTGALGKVTGLLPDRALGVREKSKLPEELNRNSVDGEYMRALDSLRRTGRDNYEMQELAGMHYFSPETQETIRKINPLTIGDQVSQMIHDRHCKPKNKPMSVDERHEYTLPTFRCGLAAQQHEDQAGVPQVTDVSKLLAASNQQQPPKIVQKPSSSHDYGFSVYLLPGDSPKTGGSEARDGNHKINNLEQCKYEIKTDYNKLNRMKSPNDELRVDKNPNPNVEFPVYDHKLNRMKSPNDELRVEKKPNPNVEFPVYDQDLTFTPDPLHGLLEQNDRFDPVRKEYNTLPLGGSRAFPRHMIRARRAKKKDSKNSNDSLNKNGNKNGGMSGSDKDDSAHDSAGGDSQSPDMEPSGDANSDTNKTSCKSWNSVDNNSDADNSAGDGQSPDIEPFGDLKIDINKTSCLSWNDDAVGNDTGGCGMTEETTVEAETGSNCPSETATPDVETCGELDINTNQTCCKSWREQNKAVQLAEQPIPT